VLTCPLVCQFTSALLAERTLPLLPIVEAIDPCLTVAV